MKHNQNNDTTKIHENEFNSKVCIDLQRYIRKYYSNPDINTAKLFAHAKALSETGGTITIEKTHRITGEFITEICDPFTAMLNKLITQEILDKLTKEVSESTQLKVYHRTRQLIYGLSTNELMKSIPDEDKMKMLLSY